MLLVEFIGQNACWTCVSFRRLSSLTGWDRYKLIVIEERLLEIENLQSSQGLVLSYFTSNPCFLSDGKYRTGNFGKRAGFE